MAKYTIKHSCGHSSTVELYGPGKDRERKMEWMSRQDCAECKAATATTAHPDLPPLKGSPKQITWATTIRAEQIERVESWIEAEEEKLGEPLHPTWYDALDALKQQTDARFWIDNRDYSPHTLLANAAKAEKEKQ